MSECPMSFCAIRISIPLRASSVQYSWRRQYGTRSAASGSGGSNLFRYILAPIAMLISRVYACQILPRIAGVMICPVDVGAIYSVAGVFFISSYSSDGIGTYLSENAVFLPRICSNWPFMSLPLHSADSDGRHPQKSINRNR